MVKSQEYINGKTIIVNGSLPKLEEIRLLRGLEFSLMPKLQMINIANSNFEDKAEGWKLERKVQKFWAKTEFFPHAPRWLLIPKITPFINL